MKRLWEYEREARLAFSVFFKVAVVCRAEKKLFWFHFTGGPINLLTTTHEHTRMQKSSNKQPHAHTNTFYLQTFSNLHTIKERTLQRIFQFPHINKSQHASPCLPTAEAEYSGCFTAIEC